MIDFAAARQMMIDSQLRPNGVTDLRIIAAFQEVPREAFLPPEMADLAYLDRDVRWPAAEPGGPDRFLLKPMVTAKLIEASAVTDRDRVLVIGSGSGYSAAIMARLAREVVALDEGPIPVKATDWLAAARNIGIVEGPLSEGWPAGGPYDVILLDGAVEFLPQPLISQLEEGGRIASVLKSGPVGKGTIWRLTQGRLTARPVFDAAAPLLPGFVRPPEFVF